MFWCVGVEYGGLFGMIGRRRVISGVLGGGNSHVHMTSMAIDTCGAQEPVRFRSMIELTIVYCRVTVECILSERIK